MFDTVISKYEKVNEKLTGASDDVDDDDVSLDTKQTLCRGAGHFRTSVTPWIFHLILMVSYSLVIFVVLPKARECSPCFGETMLNAPIVWEEKTFYSNAHTNYIDPYSRKNPDVNSAWGDLIETTISIISEEEKSKLPGGRETAPAYGGEKGYAVIIEVFHQLHCLNEIRKGFWAGNNSEVRGGFANAGGHSDHCFSYLFQTLLCHADVGVMTMQWSERQNAFNADFNVTKQCRNYDAIKNWARGRVAKFHPERRFSGSGG
ncbi:putative Tat pathway signal sequence [Seiridium cardinale]|uniref:Tat pathway signal sequence n=1 Tax=Seiridium cardinale TaxID=138064 RepID=A0ABR2XH10_9PEZI